MSKKHYWLMKCEPAAYTIDDLKHDGTTSWEGARNYQARNFMRDEMKVGDDVLFYASNADPSGVTGLAKIARAGYVDSSQFEKKHKYFDPESNPGEPRWFMVDLEHVATFPRVISLNELKKTNGLEKMVVTQKGSRLYVYAV